MTNVEEREEKIIRKAYRYGKTITISFILLYIKSE